MRERLLQAIQQEILMNGFTFTIRGMASKLGMSSKTIYQHFASKEAMIAVTLEQSIREMAMIEQEIMQNALLSLQQKLKQILCLVPSSFSFVDMELLDELRRQFPIQWKIVDDYLKEGWKNITLLLDEGMGLGVIRKVDTQVFIHMYIGSFYQLIQWHKEEGCSATIQGRLEQMVDLLLEGVYENKVREGAHE